MSDYIEDIKVLPSIWSDHSPISLLIKLNTYNNGPGLWKLNTSILKDESYIKMINDKLDNLKTDLKYIDDKNLVWELIKFQIKVESIQYGKITRRKDKCKEKELLELLKEYEEIDNMSATEIKQYEEIKQQIKHLSNITIEGQIV